MKTLLRYSVSALLAFAATIPAHAFKPIVQRLEVPASYQKIVDRMSQGKKTVNRTYGFSRDEATAAYKAQRASRADEAGYNVTVNLRYDSSEEAEQIPFFTASAYDATIDGMPDAWEMGFFDHETSAYNFEGIKAGTYNIVTYIETPEGMKVICHDNVTVNGDMTLDFDIAECTNHIVFKVVNKDGKPIASDIYDPATDYSTILIPGNYADMTGNIDLLLFYKGTCEAVFASNNFSYTLDDGTVTSLSERNYSVWLSPTVNFTAGHVDCFSDASGNHFVAQYAAENKTQTIVNDPADYVTVEEKIIETPHVQSIDPNDEFAIEIKDYVCQHYYTIQDGIIGAFSLSDLYSSGDLGVNNNVLHICKKPNGVFDIACAVAVLEDKDDMYVEGNKIVVGSDKSVTRYATMPSSDFTYTSFYNYDGDVVGKLDERFAIKTAPEMAYGASMPITVFRPMPWKKDNYQFAFASAGRLGEYRSVDAMHTSIGVRLNGESIVGGFETLGDLFNSWWENPLGEGKIEVDIANDNFVTSDGVAGLNTCHTEYDTSRDDYEPPVLCAMRTLNAEEAVVQSFATADEAAAGFVEIAATDLHMNPITGNYDMTLDAPEVKMEYAPSRSDNYKEISMTEKPEWANIPGFGRHFIGNLPKVDEKAHLGWFDLRITLTDAAGNSQSQLVRPAFQVMEVASIGQTAIDNGAAEVVAVYNLQGQRLNKPAEGQTVIELLSNGSARKVRR